MPRDFGFRRGVGARYAPTEGVFLEYFLFRQGATSEVVLKNRRNYLLRDFGFRRGVRSEVYQEWADAPYI